MADLLKPSLKDAAILLWQEIEPREGPSPEPVGLIEQRLRQIVDMERVAAETIAEARGNQLHRSGRQAEADVAWGIAAQIRLRRTDQSIIANAEETSGQTSRR